MISTSMSIYRNTIFFSLIVLIGILGGCATTPKVTIIVDGLTLPHNMEMIHLTKGTRSVDISWYYMRTYPEKLHSKDGNTETITAQEPLPLKGIHALAPDTKSIGIVVMIHNPDLLTYDITRVDAHTGQCSLNLPYYTGIKPYNMVFIKGVLPSLHVSKMGINVNLVNKDGSIADSTYIGDLMYYSVGFNSEIKKKERKAND